MARIVYFGMSGQFSRLPLEALLAAGHDVRLLVLPALALADSTRPAYTRLAPRASTVGRRALPLAGAHAPAATTLAVAAEHGIPAIEAARLRAPETLAAVAACEPDAICVACFPRRLPPELLRLPRLGCLNVHPSLLPTNRGPDPLFWTFRQGDDETGVTVHLMDEGLDSGPILLRRRIAVAEGTTEAELEFACAVSGGELLVRALAALTEGSLTPTPQDAQLATWHGVPQPEDYTITPDMAARQAYRFACGVLRRAQPLVIAVAGTSFRLLAPLGYDAAATLAEPYRLAGDELWLRCTPGVLHARVEADS
jgi:methionyl-tRNA formyltransferase